MPPSAPASSGSPVPILVVLVAAALLLTPRGPRFEGYKKRRRALPQRLVRPAARLPAGDDSPGALARRDRSARVSIAPRRSGSQTRGPWSGSPSAPTTSAAASPRSPWRRAAPRSTWAPPTAGCSSPTNSGVNWTPVFDPAASSSIGALAVDPDGPRHALRRHRRSQQRGGLLRRQRAAVARRDGGATWEHSACRDAAHRPRRRGSRRTRIASTWPPWAPSSRPAPDRGLYRSEDGRHELEQGAVRQRQHRRLRRGRQPGAPRDASSAPRWERVRRATYRRAHGPGSGIWRSADSRRAPGRGSRPACPRPPTAWGASRSRSRRRGPPSSTRRSSAARRWRLDRAAACTARRRRRHVDAARRRRSFRNAFGGFGWYFGDWRWTRTNPTACTRMGVDFRALQRTAAPTFTSIRQRAPRPTWTSTRCGSTRPTRPASTSGNDGGFYWSLNGGTTWNKSRRPAHHAVLRRRRSTPRTRPA